MRALLRYVAVGHGSDALLLAALQSDTVFNLQVQRDYEKRFQKKELTQKDFRLESEQLAHMFNEHPALFKPT